MWWCQLGAKRRPNLLPPQSGLCSDPHLPRAVWSPYFLPCHAHWPLRVQITVFKAMWQGKNKHMTSLKKGHWKEASATSMTNWVEHDSNPQEFLARDSKWSAGFPWALPKPLSVPLGSVQPGCHLASLPSPELMGMKTNEGGCGPSMTVSVHRGHGSLGAALLWLCFPRLLKCSGLQRIKAWRC